MIGPAYKVKFLTHVTLWHVEA